MTQEDDSFPCDKSVEKNNDRMSEVAVRMEMRMLWTGNSHGRCGEGLDKLYNGVLEVSNHQCVCHAFLREISRADITNFLWKGVKRHLNRELMSFIIDKCMKVMSVLGHSGVVDRRSRSACHLVTVV
jgi:hypothetical protein